MPNPIADSHRIEDAFLPVKCVTALFPELRSAASAMAQLRIAGFSDSHIQVLAGEMGAQQLDADGEKLTGLMKVLHALTQALADDAGYLNQAQTMLKQGGSLVSVNTGDEEDLVRLAARVLKESGGMGVQHWGQWRTEQF